MINMIFNTIAVVCPDRNIQIETGKLIQHPSFTSTHTSRLCGQGVVPWIKEQYDTVDT